MSETVVMSDQNQEKTLRLPDEIVILIMSLLNVSDMSNAAQVYKQRNVVLNTDIL